MPVSQRRISRRVPSRTADSIDPREVAKFSALAEEWWNPAGRFGPLHALNPVRLNYIAGVSGTHFFRQDASRLKSFAGLSLLDIGCGGGVLSEPLARLGFSVTGIDPSPANIACAANHARMFQLSIDYTCATAEDLSVSGRQFDVVVAMEVIEHVANLDSFLDCCAALIRPRGILFLATINKTLKSLALAKIAAEYILGWIPPGTHDWTRFVRPSQLSSALLRRGFSVAGAQGVVFHPLRWEWCLSDDTDVNYMLAASRAENAPLNERDG